MVASERLLGFRMILNSLSFNDLEIQWTAPLLAADPFSTMRSVSLTCIRDDPERFYSMLNDEMLVVFAISGTEKKRRVEAIESRSPG